MQQLPPLDTRVRAAWQTQVAAAVNTPGLLPAVAQRRQQQLPRFAACYPQLRALPRRVRRGPPPAGEENPARQNPPPGLGGGEKPAAPPQYTGGGCPPASISAGETHASPA